MTLNKTHVINFHPGNKEKIQTQYPICNEKYEKSDKLQEDVSLRHI